MTGTRVNKLEALEAGERALTELSILLIGSSGANGPQRDRPESHDAHTPCDLPNINAEKCFACCVHDESRAPGQQAHAEK